MTVSPSDTSSGMRLSPSSTHRPGPTATTVPSCGFSLAVSGMTRPDAVVVSASLACTRILSSSGLMLLLATIGALHLVGGPGPLPRTDVGCGPGPSRTVLVVGPELAPNPSDYQVFGIRPCPRVVVAGADAGGCPHAT